jgi:ketosteroid isomerase-like protein
MRKIAFVAAIAFCAAGARADDKAEIRAMVEKYVGDMSLATASLCTEDAVVIDGSAPYVWRGPHACDDWRRDQLAAAEKSGISEARLVLGEPLHLKVSGEVAYAAFPATLTYTKDHKTASLPGNIWTVGLRKVGGVWKIAGWSFTDR